MQGVPEQNDCISQVVSGTQLWLSEKAKNALFVNTRPENMWTDKFEMAPVYAILSTDLPEVQIEITDKHNEFRRLVSPTASNMLKMVWNAEAAKDAKSWAEQCVYSHSPESRRKVVSWSVEIDYFTFGVGPTPSNAVIGYYTQMAWYKSYEIGCAVAFCPDRALYKYYYVCHYYPAGNVVGSTTTPYKIGDPCGDCPYACDNGLCTNPCKYEYTFSNRRQLKTQYTCKHLFVLKYCLLHVADNHQLGNRGNQVAKCEPVSAEHTDIEENCKEEEGKEACDEDFHEGNISEEVSARAPRHHPPFPE
ncbi:serotriflin-like [Dermochelys coriacea]|uniref:serotriflin-like n=1 Tax=Dermochelys coriacea TaxID=27794 RepID=UPI001CA99714|nr:serotriflin-like [Dermochelys coriacea]